MLINSVISFFLLWQEKILTMLFMGLIGGKWFYSPTRNLNLKRRFLFPGSFSSDLQTFPHHCGSGSTFKIWFINAAWNIINSSFKPYELHQKGSQSTGAGQQPGTSWQTASHSAMDQRGFLREFESSSVFPPLLQPNISCRVCTYSLWIQKAILLLLYFYVVD